MKWATACSLCYLFGLVITGLLVGSIGPSVGPLARAVHRAEHDFSIVWIARGFGFMGGIVAAAQAVNWFPRHGAWCSLSHPPHCGAHIHRGARERLADCRWGWPALGACWSHVVS